MTPEEQQDEDYALEVELDRQAEHDERQRRLAEAELDEREGCMCHHNDCPYHGSIDPQDHEV